MEKNRRIFPYRSRKTMSIFLFLFILSFSHPIKGKSFDLEYVQHFITITKIEKAEVSGNEWKDVSSRVCRYDDAVRLKICKLALEEPILIRFKFRLVETETVGPETLYQIQYGGPLSSNNDTDTVTACQCPIWPPVYLQDGQEEDEIIILVVALQRPPKTTTVNAKRSSIFMG